MKSIGFFQGTDHALPGSQDITEVQGALKLSDQDKATVVRYLTSAPAAVRSLGTISYDVLDPAKPEIGPHEILTDGKWAWPNDLGFYVENHNVALDSEFLDHALAAHSAPTEVSADVVREVEALLFG